MKQGQGSYVAELEWRAFISDLHFRASEPMMPRPAADDEGWLANLTMAALDEGVNRECAERIAKRFLGWLAQGEWA